MHKQISRRVSLHDCSHAHNSTVLSTGLVVSAAILGPAPSVAERTFESMKKAKANYVPRLINGLKFYEGPLRKAIDDEDWDTVAAAVQIKVSMQRRRGKGVPTTHALLSS
jgi:hypothetical protein